MGELLAPASGEAGSLAAWPRRSRLAGATTRDVDGPQIKEATDDRSACGFESALRGSESVLRDMRDNVIDAVEESTIDIEEVQFRRRLAEMQSDIEHHRIVADSVGEATSPRHGENASTDGSPPASMRIAAP
jgi:hypothetical protein